MRYLTLAVCVLLSLLTQPVLAGGKVKKSHHHKPKVLEITSVEVAPVVIGPADANGVADEALFNVSIKAKKIAGLNGCFPDKHNGSKARRYEVRFSLTVASQSTGQVVRRVEEVVDLTPETPTGKHWSPKKHMRCLRHRWRDHFLEADFEIRFDGKDDDGAFLADGAYDIGTRACLVRIDTVTVKRHKKHCKKGKKKSCLCIEETIVKERMLGCDTFATNVTVSIDNTKPALILQTPAPNSFTNVADVVVSGTVSDAHLEKLTVNGADATLAGSSFSANVPLPSEGTIPITIIAEDKAGNATTVTVTVHRDITQPALTLNPANGTEIEDAAPELITSFSDEASGIDPTSFTATLDGVDVSSAFTVTDVEARYDIPDGEPLAGGSHTLAVTISDRAGNVRAETSSFTVKLAGDTTPPTIYLLRPSDGQEVSKTPTFRVYYDDDDSGIDVAAIKFFIDGVDSTALFTVSTISARYYVPANQPLDYGSHTFKAVVVDLAGNSVTQSSTFTVPPPDTTPPALSNITFSKTRLDPSLNPYNPPGDAKVTVTFDLSEKAAVTVLNVKSLKNNTQLYYKRSYNVDPGQSSIEWDGRTSNAKLADIGEYQLDLFVQDSSYNGTTVVLGTVKVHYSTGGVR